MLRRDAPAPLAILKSSDRRDSISWLTRWWSQWVVHRTPVPCRQTVRWTDPACLHSQPSDPATDKKRYDSRYQTDIRQLSFKMQQWNWIYKTCNTLDVSVTVRSGLCISEAPFTNMDQLQSRQRNVVTYPGSCGKELFIHSQTSVFQTLKFGNRYLISSHTI